MHAGSGRVLPPLLQTVRRFWFLRFLCLLLVVSWCWVFLCVHCWTASARMMIQSRHTAYCIAFRAFCEEPKACAALTAC